MCEKEKVVTLHLAQPGGDGKTTVKTKEVTQVDDGEHYEQGKDRIPNHDRVTLVYPSTN